jgi:hypothetical protein
VKSYPSNLLAHKKLKVTSKKQGIFEIGVWERPNVLYVAFGDLITYFTDIKRDAV